MAKAFAAPGAGEALRKHKASHSVLESYQPGSTPHASTKHISRQINGVAHICTHQAKWSG
jgi:hypothetical protein